MNSLKFYNFKILDGALIQTSTCLPFESEEDSLNDFLVLNYLGPLLHLTFCVFHGHRKFNGFI